MDLLVHGACWVYARAFRGLVAGGVQDGLVTGWSSKMSRSVIGEISPAKRAAVARFVGAHAHGARLYTRNPGDFAGLDDLVVDVTA